MDIRESNIKDNKRKGIVFNIQKFSVNDGPGIRTVVFLKGCPLRCRWCANPESQRPEVQILRDPDQCLSCRHCVEVCPRGAVYKTQGKICLHDSLCQGCLQCVRECPARALRPEGKMRTVEEVLSVVMQDLPFYEESGGGLTLSGGEMLMQPAFSLALLRSARRRGLHTCCETTGYAAPSVFARVIAPADYLLFDIKHWDAARHRAGTGVTNEVILRNLKYAVSRGKTVLPRLPVIPGYNDAPEDAQGFVRCLRALGLSRIQLLPFHQFGENKYSRLGRDYAYKNVPALHQEDLADFQKIFREEGIHAFF